MLSHEVGQRILALRKKMGKTRNEIAPLLGISVDHLYRVEKGMRNPTWDMIEKLSKAFNVPTAYFVDNEETNSSNPLDDPLVDLAAKQIPHLSPRARRVLEAVLREVSELDKPDEENKE